MKIQPMQGHERWSIYCAFRPAVCSCSVLLSPSKGVKVSLKRLKTNGPTSCHCFHTRVRDNAHYPVKRPCEVA